MPGSVRLSYEREPGFFAADPLLGETVQTLVARERPGGPPVATASRATRTVWIGGEPTRIGYLSGLRVVPEHRNARLVDGAWSAFRSMNEADPMPFTLASVTAENERARRFLTLRRGDAPTFAPLADLVTVALVVHRWTRNSERISPPGQGGPGGVDRATHRGTESTTPVPSCPGGGRREQHRDLFPASPLVLPGCATPLAHGTRQSGASGILWDPSAIRQTVVRGYDGRLARWRRPLNLALRALGAQPIPEIGQSLRSTFLTQHRATDARAHDMLLGMALAHARLAGLAFVLVGYESSDPYLRLARRRLHVPYRSTLFAAHWPDGAPPRLRRPLHAEIATF